MAEGFLRHLAGDRFEAASAGTQPTQVTPLAIAVMRDAGIDISDHQSKSAGSLLGQHFPYVITVCDQANETMPDLPRRRSAPLLVPSRPSIG